VIVEGEGYVQDISNNTRHKNLQHVTRGDIFYIHQNCSIQLISIMGSRLLAYRTFSHEEGPDHSNRTIIPTIPQKAKIDAFKSKLCIFNQNQRHNS
jgi:hypothetical protein